MHIDNTRLTELLHKAAAIEHGKEDTGQGYIRASSGRTIRACRAAGAGVSRLEVDTDTQPKEVHAWAANIVRESEHPKVLFRAYMHGGGVVDSYPVTIEVEESGGGIAVTEGATVALASALERTNAMLGGIVKGLAQEYSALAATQVEAAHQLGLNEGLVQGSDATEVERIRGETMKAIAPVIGGLMARAMDQHAAKQSAAAAAEAVEGDQPEDPGEKVLWNLQAAEALGQEAFALVLEEPSRATTEVAATLRSLHGQLGQLVAVLDAQG